MAVLGVMMMMFKEQVADQGMWPVLQRLADLDFDAVEVSQIPMDEANVAALERGTKELGLEVGAISVALKGGPTATGDNLEENFDKVVADARRLGTRFARIGMMPFTAITLCYHNHHVDLAQFDGERLFDIVRRVAPSLNFEVDLHWVQRGGMAPLDMLEAYSGVCKLIHVKDFRVTPLPQRAVDLMLAGDMAEGFQAFLSIAQFAEVGQGNMNWPKLLPAAIDAGAEYFFVEQDETYGRDPFDCVADSRAYLKGIGY